MMNPTADDFVDTGFDDPSAVYAPETITAAVTEGTMPPPVPALATVAGFTPEGKEAAKALIPMPKDFGAPQMTALARDLAMDLFTVDVIIKKHGLTNAQFEFIRDYNEYFKSTLAQQANEWQGIKSTQDRIRAQAAAAFEEQMPSIAARMGRNSEKLVEVVEAAKLFAKVAGVDNTPAGHVAGGERFTINIDLGADARIVVGAGASQPPSTPALGQREVHANPQGKG